MKRIFTAIATIGMVAGSFLSMEADVNGNGYYRVKNYGTNRWASLVDNEGSIDVNANTADLHAMRLTLDTEEILSDPASIIYIEGLGNSEYNLAAQGTSLQTLVGYTINLKANGKGNGQTLYMAYGKYKGYTKYIADGNSILTDEEGYATVNISDINSNTVKWYILPVSSSGDNYFGVVPTLTVGGKMYNPLFTSFAYAPVNKNVKSYYIGRVGFGMAEMIEINGTVPPGSAVIVECAGKNASDNKMNLLTEQNALPNNSLRGVYFDYSKYGKTNQVAYDPKTMRVLGQCSDGSLGYITSDIKYIPANTSYLVVPEGSAPELKCVNTAEYEANMPEAPEQIYLIGSMTGWDFNNGTMTLLPQDDYTYTGTFEIEAPEGNGKDVSFRFYTALGDEKNNSLGAYGANTTISFSNNTFTGAFEPGSLNTWTLPSWTGGNVSMTLNLQNQSLKLNSPNSGIKDIQALQSGFSYSNGIIKLNTPANIRVSDMAGKVVAKENGTSLDINNLPKGVYIVTINGKSAKVVK